MIDFNELILIIYIYNCRIINMIANFYYKFRLFLSPKFITKNQAKPF